MRASNRVRSLRIVAIDGGAKLSNTTTNMRVTLLRSNLQTLRAASGMGRGGIETNTEGMANKREDAPRTWTVILRVSLDATGTLGEGVINIDGSIRRDAKTVDKMLSVWKHVPLRVLFDGTEDRPAREADKGTVSEVANENAIDVISFQSAPRCRRVGLGITVPVVRVYSAATNHATYKSIDNHVVQITCLAARDLGIDTTDTSRLNAKVVISRVCTGSAARRSGKTASTDARKYIDAIRILNNPVTQISGRRILSRLLRLALLTPFAITSRKISSAVDFRRYLARRNHRLREKTDNAAATKRFKRPNFSGKVPFGTRIAPSLRYGAKRYRKTVEAGRGGMASFIISS